MLLGAPTIQQHIKHDQVPTHFVGLAPPESLSQTQTNIAQVLTMARLRILQHIKNPIVDSKIPVVDRNIPIVDSNIPNYS